MAASDVLARRTTEPEYLQQPALCCSAKTVSFCHDKHPHSGRRLLTIHNPGSGVELRPGQVNTASRPVRSPPAPVYKYLVTSLLTVLSSGIMHLAFTGGAGQSVWLAANSALMSASCLQPAPHGSQQPLQASLLTQLCLIQPLPPPPPATHPGRTHGC